MNIKEATKLIDELINSAGYMEIYGGASDAPMNVALEIAVDSMQKQEPCEWCSGEFIDPSPYIQLAIEGCELEVSLDHQDVGWYSDSFKIKFCPNCGQKLDWSEE